MSCVLGLWCLVLRDFGFEMCCDFTVICYFGFTVFGSLCLAEGCFTVMLVCMDFYWGGFVVGGFVVFFLGFGVYWIDLFLVVWICFWLFGFWGFDLVLVGIVEVCFGNFGFRSS